MAQESDLVISAGFSDAQLVKDSNKILAEYRRKGEEFQKAFVDGQGKVTDTQAMRAHQRRMENLKKAYDPAYRAAAKYKVEVERLNDALKGGALSQTQYEESVRRATRTAQQAGEAVEDLGRKGKAGGTGLQNLGFQVGDFATQVGAGTSAVQALGQQLPQLLGGMGTMGALMGAGAAIAIPLGYALAKMAMDTETLDDKLESLEKTTGAYLDAIEAVGTPLEQLRVQYGDLADEIQRVNDLTATLTAVQARGDLLGSANKFGQGLFGASGWRANVAAAYQQAAGVEETEVERIARQYGIAVEQAEKLAMARRRLETSNSEEAVAKDAEYLRDVLTEVAGGAEAAARKFPEELGTVSKLIQAAADQIAAADRAHREAQQDLLSTYDANTQKLKKLSDERRLAEESQTEAVKAGKVDQAEAYGRVLKAIDKEVEAVKQSIAEMDGTFEASVKRMQELAGGLGGTINGAIKNWTGLNLTEWGKSGAAANKGILELIAQRESGGDYNATLDNGRWTGGARNLVNMTLREIRALQEAMRTPENRATYGNGAGSSALGRYQIVGSTLDDLMKRLNLTGDELFSKEMQDRLASELLRQIKSGDVSGIRSVWAGLENVPAPLIQQAWGQQSIEPVDPEIAKDRQKALDEEIRQRENLAKQAKEYGDQLGRNLLSEQKQAELAQAQAQQIAAIKASGLSAADQSTAIAAVNAEIEKQRTIFTLLEEAKRRQVDLDAQLTNGSMTYREAIEALGEQKKQQILTTEQMAAAEERAGQKIELAADMQRQFEDGLLDAIVAGESFADVLGNLALMFAKVSLHAALFNQGPYASAGVGKGLLGGLTDWVFGGFRAAGGDVAAGRAYVVGERGPEVVVPRAAGTVIPNHKLGGGASLSYSPVLHMSGGVTQEQAVMMMRLQREEYERNFLSMLRNNMPGYNERFG